MTNDAPRLWIRTLGGLSVERDGAPVAPLVGHRKRLALLALLAEAGQDGLSREKVLAILWPESTIDQARNALNQFVHGLRRELGADALVGGAELKFNSTLVGSDCVEFRLAIEGDRLEDAVLSHHGRFLDGFHLRDAGEFERWVDDTSRALSIDYATALERLATKASNRGDTPAAVHWLRRLAEVDPLSARVARMLTEALVAAGDRENAIRHGTTYVSRVRTELDAEPDASIVARLDQLRSDAGKVELARVKTPEGSRTTAPSDSPPVAGTDIAPRSGPRVLWAAVVGTAAALVLAALFMSIDKPQQRPSAPVATIERAGPSPTPPPAAASDSSTRPKRILAPDAVGDTLASHRVRVAALENQTGDTALRSLGGLATDWVAQGIQQTGEQAVTTDSIRADIRVSSAIYRRGDALVISTRLSDGRTGALLVTLRPVVVPSATALSAAEAVRSRVAGAIASRFDRIYLSTVDPTVPPPTYEAYLEYMAGLALFYNFQALKAQQHFATAASLDSTFSPAFAWSALALSNAGQVARRDSAIAVLAARRTSLAALDRNALDYLVAEQRDDRRAMALAATAAANINPQSIWSYFTAQLAQSRNHVHEALHWFERIDPEHGWAHGWPPFWNGYMTAVHLAGDGAKEIALARRGADAGGDPLNSQRHVINGLILQHRPAEAKRELEDYLRAARTGTPNVISIAPGSAMYDVGLELRAHGMPRQADSLFARAIAWCTSADADGYVKAAPDTSRARMIVQWILATADYAAGRLDDAESVMLRLDPARIPVIAPYRGLIAAKRGDRAAAAQAIASLKELQNLNLGDLAFDEAWIYAVLGDHDLAMRQLEVAVSHMPHVFNAVHLLSDWNALKPEIHALYAEESFSPAIRGHDKSAP